jgi:uncharacterized protein (TIGR00251 family)
LSDAQLTVRVRARARGDELVGMVDGVLVARVSAPPVEGRANRSVCRLIARAVGVAPSKVTIVRGERSRDKLVGVEGMNRAELEAALRRKL